MRRLLMVLMVVMFAFSLPSLALAQEKGKAEKTAEVVKSAKPAGAAEVPKAQAAKPGMAKPEATKKEAVTRALEYRMGGVVTAVDAAAGQNYH